MNGLCHPISAPSPRPHSAAFRLSARARNEAPQTPYMWSSVGNGYPLYRLVNGKPIFLLRRHSIELQYFSCDF